MYSRSGAVTVFGEWRWWPVRGGGQWADNVMRLAFTAIGLSDGIRVEPTGVESVTSTVPLGKSTAICDSGADC